MLNIDIFSNPFILIGKAKRLKQAKEEAQEEIEQYRREREQQFQEIQQKVSFVKDRKSSLRECMHNTLYHMRVNNFI